MVCVLSGNACIWSDIVPDQADNKRVKTHPIALRCLSQIVQCKTVASVLLNPYSKRAVILGVVGVRGFRVAVVTLSFSHPSCPLLRPIITCFRGTCKHDAENRPKKIFQKGVDILSEYVL